MQFTTPLSTFHSLEGRVYHIDSECPLAWHIPFGRVRPGDGGFEPCKRCVGGRKRLQFRSLGEVKSYGGRPLPWLNLTSPNTPGLNVSI